MNSNQVIETRNGSGGSETQVYHGTQHIDEIVGKRIAEDPPRQSAGKETFVPAGLTPAGAKLENVMHCPDFNLRTMYIVTQVWVS